MKVTRVELNLEGLNELMKSAEMQDQLDAAGATVAGNAGAGYDYRTHVADYTAICNVFPTTKKAAIDNAKENTILKSAYAAGLKAKK